MILRSEIGKRVTDERPDVASRDDDRVDPGPFQLDDLVATRAREIGDRELPGRNVRQQLEKTLESRLPVSDAIGGEQEDLRINELENLTEVVLVGDAEDALETTLVRRVDEVSQNIRVIRRIDDDRVDRTGRVRRPERKHRQIAGLASKVRLVSDDEPLGPLILRIAGAGGVGDLDEHGDPVAFCDRLTQPS